LAIPNNPTGSYLTKSEVDLLISKTPKNILIVLDGAYEEFVQKDDYPNLINLVEKNENVVMTRTFSKIFGLASLRIGWSYSSKYVADILNKVRGPFNVCGAAQAAAIAALEDDEFLEKSKDHNNKWLKIFFDEVKNYEKIKLHDSVANFILFDFFKAELAQKANENFIDSGFILRDMKAYSLSNTLRMTIGNNEENEKILEFLKNYK
jgi:histidinol-phosphate aminotransferase